jgi:hypothetical protein
MLSSIAFLLCVCQGAVDDLASEVTINKSHRDRGEASSEEIMVGTEITD